MTQLCRSCDHYQNGCDIINQIQNVADTYRMEIEIKVFKCDANKEC